jgi:uncharacterized protein involved in type VI secretion and phage assembly
MAPSPLHDSAGVFSLRLTSDGRPIDSIQFASIEVRKGFNQISRALIRVGDGDVATGTFAVADDAAFESGATIEISAGYDAGTKTIFRGVVVRRGLSISEKDGALFELECLDAIAAATVERRSATFAQSTDSDAIGAVLAGYGVAVEVDATEVVHEKLVQRDCTDWDYVVGRAEVNGLLVSMDDGKISVKAPRTDREAVLKVTYGDDLLALRADQDFSGERAPARSRLRGQVRFAGSARAKVGEWLELAGLADRWSGKALITSVCHEIKSGIWITEVGVGGWPASPAGAGLAEDRSRAAPPPGRRDGGVPGLQLGMVAKVHADPAGQFRVQISVPLSGTETGVLWARLSSFYATPGAGSFFLPEVGDEVVLGFFDDDPSQPIVLGSLWSAKSPPPRLSDGANSLKAIVSKSGLTIELDDARKVLSLRTPAGNTIVVSDDAKSILLKDQNGNQVAMNEAGLLLESSKDIRLKAAGAISLSADGNVDIKSHSDASIEGLNVRHTAQVAFVAQGSASAELSASGQTVVRGALVTIN